ncbi:MAG: glycosyltransferase [Opitutales bacterium]
MRYFPRMSYRETISHVKAADAVLHVVPRLAQYIWASYPVKCLEALACGLTPLLSDFECLRKTFNNLGVYVEPQTPRALATCIENLSNDTNHIQKVLRNGPGFVRKNFSWADEFREILRVYDRLLGNKWTDFKEAK